jgi:outer membrane lipoprotein-sorting protein
VRAGRALAALVLLAAAGLLARMAPAAELAPAPAGIDADELARRAEDVLRSDSSYLEATMTIVSPRLPQDRVVRFRSWEDRAGKRSFIRILSPPKDAGTGFLKLQQNLWMYVPRVERTIRIPPSLMLQPWMGSDFVNDDLVRGSSESEDYTHRLLGVDPDPEGGEGRPAYVVEYQPREEAPVVWGRIVGWIDEEHYTPLRLEYYDEDGEAVRVMRFDRTHEVDGRWFPHRWSVRPLHQEGHQTTIEIEKIRFDAPLDASIFTTRKLQRWEH